VRLLEKNPHRHSAPEEEYHLKNKRFFGFRPHDDNEKWYHSVAGEESHTFLFKSKESKEEIL